MKSRNSIVQAALNARAERRFQNVLWNLSGNNFIHNRIVANAVRSYGKMVANGERVMPSGFKDVMNGPMTDQQKAKRGWVKDRKGDWHHKGWQEEQASSDDIGKAQTEPEAKSETKKTVEVGAAKDPVQKEMTPEDSKTMDNLVKGFEAQGKAVSAKEAAEMVVEKKDEIAKLPGEEAATAARQVEVAEKYLEKAEAKKNEEPQEEGAQGAEIKSSKVQRTADGIPAKEVKEGFSMGINTGSREGDIEEVYRLAKESEQGFKDAVGSAAQKLGLSECKWVDGHPVIDGPCFMSRSTLKSRARVEEKMDENDRQAKKDGRKSGGVNEIVDINGSTIVLGENGDFKDAIKKIEESGFDVVRTKNCFIGNAYDNTGYGDVKVNVRMPNGFVGEIIIADRYMADQKMNGAGHGLYEITRSLTKAMDSAKPEVIKNARKVRDAMNELSKLVYLKDGEDHGTFAEKKAAADKACAVMQKIVDENPQHFEKKVIENMPKLLAKIKDPATYEGYRAELKKRGLSG